MFDCAISACHARSLQNKASDSFRNQAGQIGGYGVSCVGRHDPTACILVRIGTAIVTIEITDRNVSWNDGSKRSFGRHTSNASAAPAITFSEFARRHTSGAKIPRMKTNAARITGGSAPTMIEYANKKVTAETNWITRWRVNRRIDRKS